MIGRGEKKALEGACRVSVNSRPNPSVVEKKQKEQKRGKERKNAGSMSSPGSPPSVKNRGVSKKFLSDNNGRERLLGGEEKQDSPAGKRADGQESMKVPMAYISPMTKTGKRWNQENGGGNETLWPSMQHSILGRSRKKKIEIGKAKVVKGIGSAWEVLASKKQTVGNRKKCATPKKRNEQHY